MSAKLAEAHESEPEPVKRAACEALEMTFSPKNRWQNEALVHLADGQPGSMPKGIGGQTMFNLKQAKLVVQVGYDSKLGKPVYQLTEQGIAAVTGILAD